MMYVKFEPEEWTEAKKAVLSAQAACVEAQRAGLALAKLKRDKRSAMNELFLKLKEFSEQLEKIRSFLAEEKEKPKERPELKLEKPKGKTRYELELEAIRRKIEKL